MTMKFPVCSILVVTSLLAGCATSVDPYSNRPLGKTQAIVLVGVDSAIPLSEGRYCTSLCTAWYTLGGRREIMAYPTAVGSTFQINMLLTMDNRSASLDSEPLKVTERGVYYYGTIVSSTQHVSLSNKPAPKLLLAAKRKYGTRFDDLKAVNFTWPDAASDDLGLGYASSAAVQAALAPYAGKHVNLAKIAPKKFDAGCRSGAPLSLPDFLPYEEYIRRAFNRELVTANLYGEGGDAIVLNGAMTDIMFATTGQAPFWKLGVRLDSPSGSTTSAQAKTNFEAPWSAAEACPRAEDAVPGAVQKLLEALVASPGFPALLNAPVATPAQH